MQQMGKASKWIRNFLLGKKEEKDKKKNSLSLSAETLTIPSSAILLETPKEKHRWSFRKSAIVDATPYKRTRSFDSIVATQLLTQALLVYENGQNHATARVAAPNETAKIAVAATCAPPSKPGPVQHAAATKIQAFYRSYLARKALCALKGLVKLQALVRGHLVRKQTTAMLRRVNALMTIQVRARVQRIHTAEESQPVVKRRTAHRKIILDNQLRRTSSERKDVNINETRGSLKSEKDHINRPQTETMEHGSSAYHSGSLSISKREHEFQIYPNSSTLTDMCSRTYDRQFEELSFNMAQRSSQPSSTVPTFNCTVPGPEYADPTSQDCQFEPNYMAKTESSRAKVRSQSEPKQRPKRFMKQKSRRTASVEGMNNMTQCSSSHMNDNVQQNQHPWLIKLYRSTKRIKDIKSTSKTNNSSNCKTHTAYEPAVNLY